MVELKRALWMVALAVSALLATTGCVEPLAAPTLPPTPDSATATERVTTPSVAPRYDATGLDLCARTDLTPLAEFDLTVQQRRVPSPQSGPACFFEMRTPGSQAASLVVETATFGSVPEAVAFYLAITEKTSMTPNGEIAGLGDTAAGFTRRSNIGYPYSEYRIDVRVDNLVVTAWVAMGAEDFIPKDRLSGPVVQIAVALIALVPRL